VGITCFMAALEASVLRTPWAAVLIVLMTQGNFTGEIAFEVRAFVYNGLCCFANDTLAEFVFADVSFDDCVSDGGHGSCVLVTIVWG
jgi:hypothetical protein